MHRAYGAQQPALRVMEGLQSRHSRPESDLSGSHGRGRPAGTGSIPTKGISYLIIFRSLSIVDMNSKST